MALTIHLNPVYSKLAHPDYIPPEILQRLPDGWQISEHQLQTFEALLQPSIEVVFNIAITGDGKSLAAYLPVLCKDHHSFGMYPTIELLRDQARQFEGYCHIFQRQIASLPLWGTEITRLAKD
jgi:CRISPR-associated endonuclease/helicase Cas3